MQSSESYPHIPMNASNEHQSLSETLTVLAL